MYCTEKLLCKDTVLGTQDKTMNKTAKNPSVVELIAECRKARGETQEETLYQ